MKIFHVVVLITVFASCKSSENEALKNAKALHEKQQELIAAAPEPYADKVADSMKKWIPILKAVFVNDQKDRIAVYGFTDIKEQDKLDSQNLKIVSIYLDRYGWPKKYDVGLWGQQAVNMTIQHSPLEVQEKYYPKLVEAYKQDNSLFDILALMEDRINMRRHRYQYYGSQVVYLDKKPVFYPIYKFDSVDFRRKKLSNWMPTLKEYIFILKEEINLDDYNKNLPRLIDSFHISDTPGLHFDVMSIKNR